MTAYTAPLRDIRFILHEVLDSASVATLSGYDHVTPDLIDAVLEQVATLASIVVVAAGTLGSNEIMLRSRERGLKLSDQLGRRISTNADAIAFGYDNDIPVNAVGVGFPARAKVPAPGPAVSGLIDFRRRREPAERLAVVEASVQSAMAGVLPFMLPAGAALAARSGADGRVVFADLPPGSYTVQVWHPQLRPGRPDSQQMVTLGAAGATATFPLVLLPDPREGANDPERSRY